jgi:hypothetical protein
MEPIRTKDGAHLVWDANKRHAAELWGLFDRGLVDPNLSAREFLAGTIGQSWVRPRWYRRRTISENFPKTAARYKTWKERGTGTFSGLCSNAHNGSYSLSYNDRVWVF